MKISFTSNKIITNSNQPLFIASDVFRNFFCNSKSLPKDTFSRTTVLDIALNNLNNLYFDDHDIKKTERYGAKLTFRNGKEAVDFARSHNISITFAPISNPQIHAQWCNKANSVLINDRYKNSNDPAEIYAISAAILHELSHAKDGDDLSSIQEEIDCLAMNALAFNVFRKEHPELFQSAQSPILNDGVKVYTDLFLGDNAEALAQRIHKKYGDLPLVSPNHKLSSFAQKIFSAKSQEK